MTDETHTLMKPGGDLGSQIRQMAQDSLKKKTQEAVIAQVERLVTRKDGLESHQETISKQITMINEQLAALDKNEFTVIRGRLVFNEDRLNSDPAVIFPFQSGLPNQGTL